MKKIIVRIAPAPSGFLHLGSLYIFYYNYLIFKELSAKNLNKLNRFYLRIDDTNSKKIKQKYIKGIFRDLKIFGIKYDDVIFQSKRQKIYFEKALELVKMKKAYICICSDKIKTKNKIKTKKQNHFYNRNCMNKNYQFIKNKSVIRFKNIYRNNENSTFQNIDDFIIVRSNKQSISVFAGAIDDLDYNISHVIRGNDWFLSTTKQILIFKAFNKKEPFYKHLNLIKNLDNTKLSKRNLSINLFHIIKKQGILVSTIKNWFILIGYKRKGKLFKNDINQEFFTINKIENDFEMKYIANKTPKLDMNKILWLNNKHLKNNTNINILNQIKQINLKNNQIKKRNINIWLFFINIFKYAKKTLLEIINEIEILLLNIYYHFKLFKKQIQRFEFDAKDKKKVKNILKQINKNKIKNYKNDKFIITNKLNNSINIILLIKEISILRKIIFLKNHSFSNNILKEMYNKKYFININYIKLCLNYLLKNLK